MRDTPQAVPVDVPVAKHFFTTPFVALILGNWEQLRPRPFCIAAESKGDVGELAASGHRLARFRLRLGRLRFPLGQRVAILV